MFLLCKNERSYHFGTFGDERAFHVVVRDIGSSTSALELIFKIGDVFFIGVDELKDGDEVSVFGD